MKKNIFFSIFVITIYSNVFSQECINFTDTSISYDADWFGNVLYNKDTKSIFYDTYQVVDDDLVSTIKLKQDSTTRELAKTTITFAYKLIGSDKNFFYYKKFGDKFIIKISLSDSSLIDSIEVPISFTSKTTKYSQNDLFFFYSDHKISLMKNNKNSLTMIRQKEFLKETLFDISDDLIYSYIISDDRLVIREYNLNFDLVHKQFFLANDTVKKFVNIYSCRSGITQNLHNKIFFFSNYSMQSLILYNKNICVIDKKILSMSLTDKNTGYAVIEYKTGVEKKYNVWIEEFGEASRFIITTKFRVNLIKFSLN